jgi:polar amino acid transport system substrate-binding protein
MTDVANEVAQETGIKVKVSEQRLPWKRILLHLERGKFDILAGIYNEGKVEKQDRYSLPVTTNNVHIIVKSGKEFPFSSFTDLLGKKGVHINGASHGKLFDTFARQYLDLNGVTDAIQIFDMLALNRLDYGIGSKRSMLKITTSEKYRGKFSILPHPLVENPVYFLFSRNSPCYAYIDKFNVAIQRLKENGMIRNIEKKYP